MGNTNGFEVSVCISQPFLKMRICFERCKFMNSSKKKALCRSSIYGHLRSQAESERPFSFSPGALLVDLQQKETLALLLGNSTAKYAKDSKVYKEHFDKGLKVSSQRRLKVSSQRQQKSASWPCISDTDMGAGLQEVSGSRKQDRWRKWSEQHWFHSWLTNGIFLSTSGSCKTTLGRSCQRRPWEAKEIAERRKVEKKLAARKRNSDSFISLNTWEAPTNLGVWDAAKKTKSKHHVDTSCRGLAGGREVISGSLR